jgi:phage shock protein C
MLAGVAGGLAELWDADPSLVRIVWALLVIFTGGLALVVYIIMAIVVPEEGEVAPRAAWPGTDAAWPGAAGTSGPAPSSGGAPAPASEIATGSTGAMGFTDQATTAGPSPTPSPTGWVAPPRNAREARRQARAARRAGRGESGLPWSVLGGLVLVAIGGFFLARQFLPTIDFDWFWPLMLVGLGILLIVTAVSRRPDEPGGPP